jgi:hypothetical protein
MFPMQRVAQMTVKEAAFVRNSNVFISEVTSLVRKKSVNSLLNPVQVTIRNN